MHKMEAKWGRHFCSPIKIRMLSSEFNRHVWCETQNMAFRANLVLIYTGLLRPTLLQAQQWNLKMFCERSYARKTRQFLYNTDITEVCNVLYGCYFKRRVTLPSKFMCVWRSLSWPVCCCSQWIQCQLKHGTENRVWNYTYHSCWNSQ